MHTEHITTILDLLASSGIEHDPQSIAKHHAQGIMSHVYTISSRLGTLIIHYASFSPTQEHFHPWEKLKPISDFLRTIPGVPAAEVPLTVKLPHHYIVVQKMLPGHSAGNITMQNDEIVIEWNEPPEHYEQRIEEIVAAIHATPLKGFGNLIIKEGILRGEHDSWEQFLTTEVPFWIEGIAHADTVHNIPHDGVPESISAFFHKVLPFITPLERASLVSFDIMNPSNILVDNGEITGVVDWEWALAADPAWEFSYANPFSRTHYFSRFPHLQNKESQDLFNKKVRIYEYLLHTMWTYGVSGTREGNIFSACRGRLKKKLVHASELFKELGIG